MKTLIPALAEIEGFKILHLRSTTSTNDELAVLAESGVEDGMVVWADEQTQGRGRQGRQWFSAPGSSLTFSLLIRPEEAERAFANRFTALGALALLQELSVHHYVQAQIKWPNDVLITGKKVCGVLAEISWQEELPVAVILGIGVNLTRECFPPMERAIYPVGNLEETLGVKLSPLELLHGILKAIKQIRPTLCEPCFIQKWNDSLAFRGEVMSSRNNKGEMESYRLLYINSDGSLAVLDAAGRQQVLYSGELSL